MKEIVSFGFVLGIGLTLISSIAFTFQGDYLKALMFLAIFALLMIFSKV